jgi:hypothetical protein
MKLRAQKYILLNLCQHACLGEMAFSVKPLKGTVVAYSKTSQGTFIASCCVQPMGQVTENQNIVSKTVGRRTPSVSIQLLPVHKLQRKYYINFATCLTENIIQILLKLHISRAELFQ